MNHQDRSNQLLMGLSSQLPNLDLLPVPQSVFHYTDSAGLLGIMSSGRLWATDYRFLNDSSEIRYTYGLAAELARGSLTEGLSHLGRSFFEQASSSSPPYTGCPYYLCCFSEHGNSLSQWRAYGLRQGFAVECPGDLSTTRGSHASRQNPGITLLRVEYVVARQADYILALQGAMLTLFEDPHFANYANSADVLRHTMPFYWAQLERASYRFKHPAFEVEKEWRLVSWGDVHDEKYRAAQTLTPFIELRLFSGRVEHPEDKLPVHSVRQGPGALGDATMVALDRFLSRSGYPETRCRRLHCNTPARV